MKDALCELVPKSIWIINSKYYLKDDCEIIEANWYKIKEKSINYMAPELKEIESFEETKKLNREKCNMFSMGIILLRMNLLLVETDIIDLTRD